METIKNILLTIGTAIITFLKNLWIWFREGIAKIWLLAAHFVENHPEGVAVYLLFSTFAVLVLLVLVLQVGKWHTHTLVQEKVEAPPKTSINVKKDTVFIKDTIVKAVVVAVIILILVGFFS